MKDDKIYEMLNDAEIDLNEYEAVSYTHLTLPTTSRV